MNIHKYQAKELLNTYGVAVDNGFMAQSAGEVEQRLGGDTALTKKLVLVR